MLWNDCCSTLDSCSTPAGLTHTPFFASFQSSTRSLAGLLPRRPLNIVKRHKSKSQSSANADQFTSERCQLSAAAFYRPVYCFSLVISDCEGSSAGRCSFTCRILLRWYIIRTAVNLSTSTASSSLWCCNYSAFTYLQALFIT